MAVTGESGVTPSGASPSAAGGRLDLAELRRRYDEQLRREAEVTHALEVVEHGPLLWSVFPGGRGFVTYRDLGGLEGADLDRLIAETVAHFRDDPSVIRFEWKTRGHDLSSDLPDRLVANGILPEDVETVMIGRADAVAAPVDLPPGFVVREAGSTGDLEGDVTRLTALQHEAFGSDAGPSVEETLAAVRGSAGAVRLWLAETVGAGSAGAGGGSSAAAVASDPDGAPATVVSGGRLEIVPGTAFAGLWGGATLAAYRGRGIYREVTAARARAAVEAGVVYLQSDCTPFSRPILERSGLVAVTTTTPYVWRR